MGGGGEGGIIEGLTVIYDYQNEILGNKNVIKLIEMSIVYTSVKNKKIWNSLVFSILLFHQICNPYSCVLWPGNVEE